jgi:lantibiotic biosynthesis protein
MPGGEWLYAKIYVPDILQQQVLVQHLPQLTGSSELCAANADTWFFLRYADPDPHLRLRFHGKPDGLWPVLLPALRDWAEELRDAGLADRLVLDTYDPEIERYGGPAAMGHAERVFHADSAVVLGHLATPSAGGPELAPVTLAALGILDILTRLGSADEAPEWLGDERFLARRSDVPRLTKEVVADSLDQYDRPRPPMPGTPDLAGAWAAREAALTRLRDVLATVPPGPGRRASVAMSLAHMHCNRLLGPRREEEVLAHVTAREGLALRLSRKRHGR